MSDLFPNIIDFIKCKEKCFFCNTKLKCRLTNFIGMGENGVPLINASLENNKFIFDISRTTASYELKAKITIDAKTNVMTLLVDTSGTPSIDTMIAKATFIDFRPYIQLYCPHKKCPHEYTVAGDILKVALGQDESWLIMPFKLYYESFVEGKLWVQNDYIQSHTAICSSVRVGWDIEPLIVPLMDFDDMGKNKVLTRVKTYAVFS